MGACLASCLGLVNQPTYHDEISIQRSLRVVIHDETEKPILEGFQSQAPRWEADSESKQCYACNADFTLLNRKHHCRRCGNVFCDPCSSKRCKLLLFAVRDLVRVCDRCCNEAPLENQFVESHLPRLRAGSSFFRHGGPLGVIGGAQGHLSLAKAGDCLIFNTNRGSVDEYQLAKIIHVDQPRSSPVLWVLQFEDKREVSFDARDASESFAWARAVGAAAKLKRTPDVATAVYDERSRRKAEINLRQRMMKQFESKHQRRQNNSEKREKLAAKYSIRRNGSSKKQP